jgi:hypothetical protein
LAWDESDEEHLCCLGECIYEITPENIRRAVAQAHWNHWILSDYEAAEWWDDFGGLEGPITITFDLGGNE